MRFAALGGCVPKLMPLSVVVFLSRSFALSEVQPCRRYLSGVSCQRYLSGVATAPVSDVADLSVSFVEGVRARVIRESAREGRTGPCSPPDGPEGLVLFGAIAGVVLAAFRRRSRPVPRGLVALRSCRSRIGYVCLRR